MFGKKNPPERLTAAQVREVERMERVYQARQARERAERNQVPACACGHPLFRGRCPEGHR